MGSPTFEEKVLVAWSSVYNTNQSSIFIFKCKNKKIIYMGVQICVLSLKDKTRSGRWEPKLRREV